MPRLPTRAQPIISRRRVRIFVEAFATGMSITMSLRENPDIFDSPYRFSRPWLVLKNNQPTHPAHPGIEFNTPLNPHTVHAVNTCVFDSDELLIPSREMR